MTQDRGRAIRSKKSQHHDTFSLNDLELLGVVWTAYVERVLQGERPDQERRLS